MIKTWLVSGIALLALTACAGGEKASMHSSAAGAISSGPNVVNVSATEYRIPCPRAPPCSASLTTATSSIT